MHEIERFGKTRGGNGDIRSEGTLNQIQMATNRPAAESAELRAKAREKSCVATSRNCEAVTPQTAVPSM
jgi:hypothetical protein